MPFKRFHNLFYPDAFQGEGRTRNYFEGWYFKLVSADARHAIAVIPGISFDAEGRGHAFIQVMDGKACKAYYHTFETTDFRATPRNFEVFVGKNYFSAQRISLDLPGLRGDISFEDTVSWPKMMGAPGIMGWYSFVPFMQCNHGMVSMNHRLQGSLYLNDEEVNISGGKGYIEKDWGSSFPKAYTWMQSNHFDRCDRASLMASVAHIPWLGSYFIGFISGFWIEGRLFRFATYTGARKHLNIKDEQLELILKNPKTELRILARQAAGTALVSPLSGAMTGKINESLQAVLQVELRENGQLIFEGIGENAGLEVVGAVDKM
jgi:tocopherol cyclase